MTNRISKFTCLDLPELEITLDSHSPRWMDFDAATQLWLESTSPVVIAVDYGFGVICYRMDYSINAALVL